MRLRRCGEARHHGGLVTHEREEAMIMADQIAITIPAASPR